MAIDKTLKIRSISRNSLNVSCYSVNVFSGYFMLQKIKNPCKKHGVRIQSK